MTSAFAGGFDDLSQWRGALRAGAIALRRRLDEHALSDPQVDAILAALQERLEADRLVVAFVAEFSRGKTELINAIVFADTGRRILPATPGRTTMCPVELSYDATAPTTLALLPIETRVAGLSLAAFREQAQAWTHLPLDPRQPDQMLDVLSEVMRTRKANLDEARSLGLWASSDPDDQPRPDDDGRVEVPVWRHALINYPHPLLEQGLVVLDTPGLNALGTEPELTLGQLASAHATVFIVGADTGVTRSDMAIWRDHLGTQRHSVFVVLNKIDALIDPLASSQEIAAQIDQQQRSTAELLGVAPDRVFALSARQALVARIESDEAALAASRVLDFERALAAELLPRRQQVLRQLVDETCARVHRHVTRKVGDLRRQLAEQMLELRGLRGKSSGKLQIMIDRIALEATEFEHCHSRLAALRSLHSKLLQETLSVLSAEHLDAEVDEFERQLPSGPFGIGKRKVFAALCARLVERVVTTRRQTGEMRAMFEGTFARLNAEFGLGLVSLPEPDFTRFIDDLGVVGQSYGQYLERDQAVRWLRPQFMAQFRSLLIPRLSVVFDGATNELERWSQSAIAHVDAQLHERRSSFQRRSESLVRIRSASENLESRIAEIERQERQLQRRLEEVDARIREVVERAAASGMHASPGLAVDQRASA
jgi:hypothetical protein